MISNNFFYFRVYSEDFDFIPSTNSHLLLFMNLDLFNSGKFDLEGKLVAIEKLNGSRLGLLVSYKAEKEKDQKTISEFVRNHYTPRYSVRFAVDIRTDTEFIPALAINLSEKGIFIEAPLNHLEEREICTLLLHLDDSSISVKAQVSWINKGKMYDKPNGYGLKFIYDTNTESKILRYLEKLKNRSSILR
ncbi:MAG: PilZ domain-containing protein [Leptospiraceae bacterium]|nr:PilZ domain-containing protein [Leptospiraceae bacterium]